MHWNFFNPLLSIIIVHLTKTLIINLKYISHIFLINFYMLFQEKHKSFREKIMKEYFQYVRDVRVEEKQGNFGFFFF